jgi:hypothetical protein
LDVKDANGYCDGAESMSKDVCKIGKSCCKDCQDELGALMECLLNTVVKSIVAEDNNGIDSEDIPECPLDCGKRRKGRRVEREPEPTNETIALDDGTLNGKCQSYMTIGMVDGDYPTACHDYMGCVLGNTIADIPAGIDDPASAAVSFKIAEFTAVAIGFVFWKLF